MLAAVAAYRTFFLDLRVCPSVKDAEGWRSTLLPPPSLHPPGTLPGWLGALPAQSCARTFLWCPLAVDQRSAAFYLEPEWT